MWLFKENKWDGKRFYLALVNTSFKTNSTARSCGFIAGVGNLSMISPRRQIRFAGGGAVCVRGRNNAR